MATNCDVMVAHSPPAFRHNRNSASSGFYATYGNCRFQTYPTPPLSVSKVSSANGNSRRHASPLRIAPSSPSGVTGTLQERKPRRPCLVTRCSDEGSSSSGDENEPPSPTRQKKKVVFADDRGFSLTQVKMMVEQPYDFPVGFAPFRDYSSKTTVTDNAHVEQIPAQPRPNEKTESWKTMFSQPASNYLDFRRKLDQENVSLENVIIKQNIPEKEIVGTIKVKNICFEKSVFVRATTDEWATHQDVPCTFVDTNRNNAGSSAIVIIYDTFSFKVSLPFSEKNVEFCVCFKTTNGEFWDNNNGNNYKIVKNMEPRLDLPPSKMLTRRARTWPEFNAWIDEAAKVEASYW